MLQAVELPARIPHLDASLPDMDADDLPHLYFSCGPGLGAQEQTLSRGKKACALERLCTTAHGEIGVLPPEQTGEKEDKAA
jgi:hypothetical protein